MVEVHVALGLHLKAVTAVAITVVKLTELEVHLQQLALLLSAQSVHG